MVQKIGTWFTRNLQALKQHLIASQKIECWFLVVLQNWSFYGYSNLTCRQKPIYFTAKTLFLKMPNTIGLGNLTKFFYYSLYLNYTTLSLPLHICYSPFLFNSEKTLFLYCIWPKTSDSLGFFCKFTISWYCFVIFKTM